MRILVSCLLLPMFLFPAGADASGAPNAFPSFALTKRPDFPLESFASGHLGVVRSSWACSYLVVVYRYLAGLPTDGAQQRAFLSVWRQRLGEGQGDIPIEPRLEVDASLSLWLATRRKVHLEGGDSPGELSPWKDSPKGYFGYLNCTAGAFDKAAETLEDRIERLGVASPEVRAWLAAQDLVFDNCSGRKAPQIPPATSPDDDPLIRFDRSYQIAAAHFYAGNHDDAEKAFGVIATDLASPWRNWARLIQMRILVRRAELQAANADEQAALVNHASTGLRGILSDNSLAEVHDAARSLLHIICARRHDPAAAAFLASGILQPADIKVLAWDFDAYTFSPYSRHVIDPSKAEDDMTRWIGAIAGEGDRGFAATRWREEPSLLWLVAALANARPEDPSLSDLLAAAAKVSVDSPAWPTVTYYRLSLEPSTQKARMELDALLPMIARSLPPTSRNLFAALRFSLAGDLGDLLQHAPRVPVAVLGQESEEMGDYDSGWEPLFAPDVAMVFNAQLPVAVLGEAAKRSNLPKRLRNELARVTWVRAVLLDDHETAGEVAGLIRSLTGAASSRGLSRDLSAYLDAKTASERNLAVALVLGRNPGLSPWVRYGFLRKDPPEELGRPHTNWWAIDGVNAAMQTDLGLHPPAFLDDNELAKAEAERQKLLMLGNGPTCLGRLAMSAAEALPRDPVVPELLHRVVLASSQGRGDAQTGEWSKAAFSMLHSRFPTSAWTKKTPYWYR